MTTDFLFQKLLQNFLMVILMGVCLALFAASLIYYQSVRYCRTSAEEVLTDGLEGTYILHVSGEQYNTEEGTAFQRELYESPAIGAVGFFDYWGLSHSCLNPLKEIQKGHTLTEQYEIHNELEVYNISRDVLELCSFELESGTAPEELDLSDESCVYMYLGHAYADIPVGTVYELNQYGYHVTYEVAGIMQEGQRFLTTGLERVSSMNVKGYDVLDYTVMFLHDDPMSSLWYFSVKDGNYQEAARAIEEAAEPYGISYYIESLEEKFDELDEENSAFLNITVHMAVFMLVITVVLLCSQQIVNFMNCRREYGILYTTGMTERDILSVLVMETVVKAGAALLIALGVVWLISVGMFERDSQTSYILKDILTGRVYPVLVLLAVLLGVVSVFIPAAAMHRNTPIQLMRED